MSISHLIKEGFVAVATSGFGMDTVYLIPKDARCAIKLFNLMRRNSVVTTALGSTKSVSRYLNDKARV